MIFQGFRIPEGQIEDMKDIHKKTGISKSQLVRIGLHNVINDFYQKEKNKADKHPQNRGNKK